MARGKGDLYLQEFPFLFDNICIPFDDDLVSFSWFLPLILCVYYCLSFAKSSDYLNINIITVPLTIKSLVKEDDVIIFITSG
tara:strand:+ start:125 stop:370 length:246 start_codon:yes stop_codon:yes gene_type:complete